MATHTVKERERERARIIAIIIIRRQCCRKHWKQLLRHFKAWTQLELQSKRSRCSRATGARAFLSSCFDAQTFGHLGAGQLRAYGAHCRGDLAATSDGQK